ncbi:MAG: hypothetical protein ACRCXM_17400, partial [Beijerinckiaceae bacterium]
PVLLVTALTAADLRINNGPNESTGLKYRQYDILDPATKNETIRFLKERLAARSNSDRRDRVELVGLGFEWPNAGLVHGFDHTLGYNPLRMADFAQATGAIDTIAGPDQKHFSRLFPRYRCKMADMLGLRYIVSSIPIEKVDTQYKQGDLRFITRTKDGFIYENPNALPRVLFTSEFRVADFEELQRTGVWPDFDARKTVLLDAVPDEPLANNLDNGGPSKVSLTRYENTSIEISVEAGQAGFVVLNDMYHDWWEATLDGKPVDILRANVLFRAVMVPAGKHVLKFEFKPLNGVVADLKERVLGEEE